LCFFNLILPRHGMYVGMGMSFEGRGNEKGRTNGGSAGRENGKGRTGNGGRTWEWTVRGGRGNGKGRTGNENGRTQNGSLPLTVLISSRDNLILARRGMYVGMGMSFAGRGNEKDKTNGGSAGRENGKGRTGNGGRTWEWTVRGGREEWKRQNREWEWQNMEWQPTPYCLNK
jgi:hypothetical protein